MCENHQHDPGTAQGRVPHARAAGTDRHRRQLLRLEHRRGPPTVEELDDVAGCPVMTGTPVNKAQAEAAGLYRDHNGQRYWFCCATCGPSWDADPDQGDVAECPVMTGTPVNKAQAEAAGLYRDHNGQRYWFCCAACGPMWDADPDEYAAA